MLISAFVSSCACFDSFRSYLSALVYPLVTPLSKSYTSIITNGFYWTFSPWVWSPFVLWNDLITISADHYRSITCQNDKTHACNSVAVSKHYRGNLRYLSKDANKNEFIWHCELNHIEYSWTHQPCRLIKLVLYNWFKKLLLTIYSTFAFQKFELKR